MNVEFNLSHNITIKISNQSDTLPSNPDDKYLLFKYFGIKNRLFGIFLCITKEWFERDLKILLNQITESFDSSFGSFNMFENECISLLCTGNIVLMNHAIQIIKHAIENKHYTINGHQVIQILTRIYFHIDNYHGSISDEFGWNYFNNLQHNLNKDQSIFNIYKQITRVLINFCEPKFNISNHDLSTIMPWCKNQWICFSDFLTKIIR